MKDLDPPILGIKKKAISQELNVGLTSNQAVNLSFFVV